MAVQLLEEWLLKEQAKLQQNYRELNQLSIKEPDIIFIGDSIVEYYPLQELLQTDKRLINRGIRGYKTDLLLQNLDLDDKYDIYNLDDNLFAFVKQQ